MQFNKEDAIRILTQVCRACPATADQHDYMRFILTTIDEKLKKLEAIEQSEGK